MLYEEDRSVDNGRSAWRKRDDLERSAITPINASVLAIKENSLNDSGNYRLVISARSPKALLGQSTYIFSVSPPPNGGICFIEPPMGTSLETDFTLSCNSWRSKKGPLSYRFQYDIHRGLLGVIYHGLNNTVVSQLPAGVMSNNYTLDIVATVTDKSGTSASAIHVTVQVGFKRRKPFFIWFCCLKYILNLK